VKEAMHVDVVSRHGSSSSNQIRNRAANVVKRENGDTIGISSAMRQRKLLGGGNFKRWAGKNRNNIRGRMKLKPE